jgi:hypothetical protein
VATAAEAVLEAVAVAVVRQRLLAAVVAGPVSPTLEPLRVTLACLCVLATTHKLAAPA